MKKAIIALAVILSAFFCSSWVWEPPAMADAPEAAEAGESVTEMRETVTETADAVPLKAKAVRLLEELAKPTEEEQQEIFLVANVLAGECYDFEHEDMLKVGMGILNRVDSSDPNFPDTVLGVVSQPGQMQYLPGREISQPYIDAAEEIYKAWKNDGEGASIPWDSSILFWGAGGGYTNIFSNRMIGG